MYTGRAAFKIEVRLGDLFISAACWILDKLYFGEE